MTCAALPADDRLPDWLDHDRRRETRSRTIFCHGKLMVSGTEQICQVRNISPRGISIESRGLPQPGQRVRIEMRGMAPSPAVVIWRDPLRCGLIFESEQDVDAIFAKRRETTRQQPRGPRFRLRRAAEFASPEGASRLEALDISVGGLKLWGEVAGPVGCYGVVRLAGLAGDLCGRICWKRGGLIGFRFEQAISGDRLFDILSSPGGAA